MASVPPDNRNRSENKKKRSNKPIFIHYLIILYANTFLVSPFLLLREFQCTNLGRKLLLKDKKINDIPFSTFNKKKTSFKMPSINCQ